jgi:hypothetical protein
VFGPLSLFPPAEMYYLKDGFSIFPFFNAWHFSYTDQIVEGRVRISSTFYSQTLGCTTLFFLVPLKSRVRSRKWKPLVFLAQAGKQTKSILVSVCVCVCVCVIHVFVETILNTVISLQGGGCDILMQWSLPWRKWRIGWSLLSSMLEANK